MVWHTVLQVGNNKNNVKRRLFRRIMYSFVTVIVKCATNIPIVTESYFLIRIAVSEGGLA